MDAKREQLDHELMAAVAMGDRAAFEQIVIAYRLSGIAFAASICGDTNRAEEIVQDCFVKIWLRRALYDSDSKKRETATFRTYLYTLIRNAAIDDLRRRKTGRIATERLIESASEILSDPSAESVLIDREQRELIKSIFGTLQRDRRTALYLFAVEELSYKEIAKVMKKTVGQVKITIHRARAQLKKQIKARGDFSDEE